MTKTIEIENISPYEHIIAAQQFSLEYLAELFEGADRFRSWDRRRRSYECRVGHELDDLKGWNIVIGFYEPSTRTRFSFDIASRNLGANVAFSDSLGFFSSVSKGESLEHTVQTLSCYGDIIIMRFSEEGDAERAVRAAEEIYRKGGNKVGIINSGDGKGQHPTQALLDLYTIFSNQGRLNNLTIAMVGDLSRGRTVRSLSYLLGKLEIPPEDADNVTLNKLGLIRDPQNNRIIFVAHDSCQIGYDIREYLVNHRVEHELTDDLTSVLPQADVVYMTRTQKERFNSEDEFRRVAGRYRINSDNVKLMKESAALMHPLPIDRKDGMEISLDVDKDHRAVYLPAQVQNGLYIRMAMLKLMQKNYHR